MDTVLRVAVCDDDSMERAILQKHIMECSVYAFFIGRGAFGRILCRAL